MTNLERLEKDIREKLPRLMELTEGCIFKSIKYTYKIIYYDKISKLFKVLYINDGDCTWKYQEEIYNQTIIGHDILLNDILEWLGTINQDYTFENNGFLLYYYEDGYCRIEGSTKPKWDLSKPLLKDQPQELIDYLASLI